MPGGLSSYNILVFYLFFVSILSFFIVFTDFAAFAGLTSSSINAPAPPTVTDLISGLLLIPNLLVYFFNLTVFGFFSGSAFAAALGLLVTTPLIALLLVAIIDTFLPV